MRRARHTAARLRQATVRRYLCTNFRRTRRNDFLSPGSLDPLARLSGPEKPAATPQWKLPAGGFTSGSCGRAARRGGRMRESRGAERSGDRGRQSGDDSVVKNDGCCGETRGGIADAKAERAVRQRTARRYALYRRRLRGGRRLAGRANRRVDIDGRRVRDQRPQRVARDAENCQPGEETALHKAPTIGRLFRCGQSPARVAYNT